VDGAGLGRIAVGRGGEDADGGLAAGGVLLVSEDAQDGTADDLRDGLDALNRWGQGLVELEAVTQALPQDLFKRKWLGECDGFFPDAGALADFHAALNAAQGVVLRIEHLYD